MKDSQLKRTDIQYDTMHLSNTSINDKYLLHSSIPGSIINVFFKPHLIHFLVHDHATFPVIPSLLLVGLDY